MGSSRLGSCVAVLAHHVIPHIHTHVKCEVKTYWNMGMGDLWLRGISGLNGRAFMAQMGGVVMAE